MSGNSHGYLCPNCNKGDNLEIAAIHWVKLVPDGTGYAQDGSEQWDDNSAARCTNCDWSGFVEELLEEETTEENENAWVNHYFHHDQQWDDTWSCQCNDECPVCHREIEPYASTESESGEVQIHNRQVFDMVEREEKCCAVCGDAVHQRESCG